MVPMKVLDPRLPHRGDKPMRVDVSRFTSGVSQHGPFRRPVIGRQQVHSSQQSSVAPPPARHSLLWDKRDTGLEVYVFPSKTKVHTSSTEACVEGKIQLRLVLRPFWPRTDGQT